MLNTKTTFCHIQVAHDLNDIVFHRSESVTWIRETVAAPLRKILQLAPTNEPGLLLKISL